MKKRYPCKNCEDRHYICWDGCDRYLEVKNTVIPVNELDKYLANKSYYKTRYGWRKNK